jgi:glucose-6-phosphate dehydrogenase assembly protein OpcA
MSSAPAGAPPAIDIAAIERELGQLWKDSAADPAAQGHAVTRALTLNLVARARSREDGDRISEVVQGLTASHPNRAVLVIDQPGAPDTRLEAYAQANCLLTTRGVPQVCGEQVTITASGSATAQAPSLVLPLLVPDLPVALWLPGPAPLADRLLARLRGVIDRLIVDSRDFAEPARELAELAGFDRSVVSGPGNGPQGPAVSDLSWARLTAWRELTAQFFDTRPLLPHLRRIDHVELIYAAAERPNPAQALLLAGWLAASLGWVPLEEAVSVEGSAIRLHLRRPAVGVGPSAIRLVTIDLRAAPAIPGDQIGLQALHLRAVDGVQADFSVERTDDPTCVRTTAQVAGQPTISRIARVEQPGLASLLAAELRLLSHDRTFSAALRAAGAFAGRLG